MENNNKTTMFVVGAIVAVLIIGGIVFTLASNDNNDEDTTNESMENEEAMEASSNIVELASETSSLSTLVTAVQAANLVDALSDQDSSLTVFAPNNSAFSEIQSTVDTLLLPENLAQLQNVLQYHVVASEVFSTDLQDGQVVETLNGETLKVRIINGEVFVNNSRVIQADIEASNGVVHVIDSVLVPGAFKNVVGTAMDTADLSTLVAAVSAANLVDALSDETANYTVFAPNNSAFSAIQSTVNTLLKPENLSQLQNVLQYHVVASEVFSSELKDGQTVTTLNGETLKISIEGEKVFIVGTTNRAEVILADVKTSNGVVHVINSVLVP